ncbi:MAG TPA: tRNA (adenosine(37)-N6)-threonylcarbamoyltransferase complex transferase subunit TsaD [Bacteroidia bacterium]|jgi:N6-L-threonylcarbamoyladenine synthase|nr:tRNA (adenosine(37)-N6)-threonylcarbamoyltransferase complex transferase subunit TsaD [Bacteroidia bacterium]
MIITQNDILILAIESSCDDTSAAVLHNRAVLSNVVANQDIHKQYGGVVPELASRDHQKNIIPVVDAALKKAGKDLTQINAIAFTRGPGLLGSLLVGSSFAKSMAQALRIPLIEVNHMQGHILAHFIEGTSDEGQVTKGPAFPFLCLTVSGGHTQLVKANDYLSFELLGETLDDAVGEAFDKAAKILGLPYPGGPLIDKYAKDGNHLAYKFPISAMPGNNYSFSGIKTAFLYFIKNETKKNPDFIKQNMADICASYQWCLSEILFKKLFKAAQEQNIKTLALAGGVSANSLLRSRLKKMEKEGYTVFIPPFEYCTDNAAMIGIAAYFKYLKKDFAGLNITPTAQYSL